MNNLKKKPKEASTKESIIKDDDRFSIVAEEDNYKVVEVKETGSVTSIFKRA